MGETIAPGRDRGSDETAALGRKRPESGEIDRSTVVGNPPAESAVLGVSAYTTVSGGRTDSHTVHEKLHRY
jgi:hypothetical protein